MLIVSGGDVVTMNPAREVLIGGSVAVDGTEIVAVGATASLLARFPGADRVDVTGCVVTPGLVDAHQHLTVDPLLRCCIPDRIPSDEAIFGWAVPVHARVDPLDDEISATLGAIEALTNGVTTLVESGTVSHPDAVAAALSATGVRAAVGGWGWDVGDGPGVAPAEEVLDRQRALLERHPAGGRVEAWVTLVGHDLASDALLAGAADLARSAGVPLTMHLSPTGADVDSYLRRTGRRPVVHLADLGVLGRHLLLAHAVWLDDAEADLLLTSGTAIASCPWAYLRLGQGFVRRSRHAELYRRGGRVALGCDSANAGDSIDVLRTAALFAGLARDATLDPTAFGASDAFELATIAGAEAIGLADRVGSLEVGKQADLVVHTTAASSWRPVGDLALNLVWGTDGRSVRDVFVAGEHVVRDGVVTTVDAEEVGRIAGERRRVLLDRAGVRPVPTWPEVDAR